MQWFNNMALKGKLLTGFIVVAIIAVVIGLFGTYKINQIADADAKMYEKVAVALGELGEISTNFQRMRVNSREVIMAVTPEENRNLLIASRHCGLKMIKILPTMNRQYLPTRGAGYSKNIKNSVQPTDQRWTRRLRWPCRVTTLKHGHICKARLAKHPVICRTVLKSWLRAS